MTKIYSINEDYKNYDFHIAWVLTDECNFRCSYCFRASKPRKPIPKDTIMGVVKQLNDFSLRYKIKVIMTGGEVTTLPYFEEVVKNLNENIALELNTNGMLLSNDNLFKRFKFISMSLHSEYFEKQKSKLDVILNLKDTIHLNIVYNYKNYKKAIEIASWCKKYNLYFTLVKDQNDDYLLDSKILSDSSSYYQKDIILDAGYCKKYLSIDDILNNKIYKLFKGSFCYNNFITIEYNKIKYSCGIKFFKKLCDISDGNKVYCNQDCVDVYAFVDTTKILLRKDIHKFIDL